MKLRILGASLLLVVTHVASATNSRTEQPRYQRQFQYAQVMMRLNGIGGDLSASELAEAKVKRADVFAQRPREQAASDIAIDAFADAVEGALASRRAKRALSRQWLISELHPIHWSVSANPQAAADCSRAIEHVLGQPLRIEMDRDGAAWLRVVAPGPGHWSFDTLIGEFDTKLSVFRDCRDIVGDPAQVSDDAVGLGAIVGLQAKSAGQTFLIRIERKGGLGSLVIAKSGPSESISGRVVRASDGLAVNGWVGAYRSGSLRASASTNDVGYYTLNLQETGDFKIVAFGGDREVPEMYPAALCYSHSQSNYPLCEGQSSSVLVSSGQNVTDIDFALDTASVLGGTVTDQVTGLPVAYAKVGVVRHLDVNEQYSRRITYADAHGRFRVGSLPAESWRVDAAAARYGTERWPDVPCPFGQCPAGSGTPIQTQAGLTENIAIELDPRPYLRLRPVLNGMPLQGPSVTIYDQNGNYLEHATGVLEDGSVEIGPLTSGPVRLRLSAGGVFSRMLGATNSCASWWCDAERLSGTLIDLPQGVLQLADVEMHALPSVRGTVTDAATGQPVAGARVGLYSNTGGFGMESITDAAGQYLISNPLPDQYRLLFTSERHIDEVHPGLPCDEVVGPMCPMGSVVSIVPSSPAELVIDATLSASTQIHGTIGSFFGIPWENSVVGERIAADGSVLSSHVVYPDYGTGAYVRHEVPIGSHHWAIRSHNYATQVYPGINCAPAVAGVYQGCALDAAATLDTQLGAPVGPVDFKLVSIRSRVVTVTDGDTGQPIDNVAIDLWRADHTWLSSVRTDAHGQALLRQYLGAPSEAYLVSTDNETGFVNQVYDNHFCAPGASAYHGSCSLEAGSPLWLWVDANPLPGIRIVLSRNSLFASGFE